MEQKLESFLTVCHTMHYGKAAKLLNLSQPAVSKHVQALESQYGVKLFTYSGHQLHKTKQGEILQAYAQSLRYNEQMLLARMQEGRKNLLRIGAGKAIGKHMLFPYIRRFLSNSQNQLEFIVDNRAQLLELLNQGELDFVFLEGDFDKLKYDWRIFRKEFYLGICPKYHPFSEKRISVTDLFEERILLPEKGSGTREILERGLTNEGYSFEAFADQACIGSFDMIKALVGERCGISFLYEAVVKGDARLGHFTCPPLTGIHEFNIVYLQHTEAYAKAKQFLGL